MIEQTNSSILPSDTIVLPEYMWYRIR